MEYSYEFKKECVQLYREGKCADIPEVNKIDYMFSIHCYLAHNYSQFVYGLGLGLTGKHSSRPYFFAYFSFR